MSTVEFGIALLIAIIFLVGWSFWLTREKSKPVASEEPVFKYRVVEKVFSNGNTFYVMENWSFGKWRELYSYYSGDKERVIELCKRMNVPTPTVVSSHAIYPCNCGGH